MYDLHHLEHAIAIIDHGGFRRAAEALGVSQPTLTRSVQHLESSLGAALLERSKRGVEATAVGRVVLERGRALLRDRRSLEREVEMLKGLEIGHLELGMGPYPAALAGHLAVSRLLSRHPGVHCRVRVMDWEGITQAVANGRCDLGLAELSVAEGDPDLEIETVMTRRAHFACRPDHEILRRPSVGLHDLLDYPWACSTVPDRVASRLPADVGRAGRRRRGGFVPAICLDVVTDIARMARASEALCAVTLTMVADELESGTIRIVPFSPPWLRLNSGFITRRNRTPSPVTAAFMELVREVDAELEAREAKLAARHLDPRSATPAPPRRAR